MATKKENKRTMIKLYLTITAGFVVLAGICAILAISETALAKKLGGGTGGSTIILARVDFGEGYALANDSGERVSGFTPYNDGTHPDGLAWHYWDSRDTECGDGGGLNSSVSGGGSWTFNTAGFGAPIDRWVVFHWTPSPNDPDAPDPDLDQYIYEDSKDVLPGGHGGPEVDSTPYVDNLNIRINADVVFKNNNTRQPLEIKIQYGAGSGPVYFLNYLEPLYVLQNYQGNPDLAVLTSIGSDGNPDVHDAELIESVDLTTGESYTHNSKPVIGTYSMPIKVILRRVYVQ